MAQTRDARVMKRTGSQLGETGRRRAPYALRACDACRRRKGKCDGRRPCRYCAGRSQTCSYDTIFGSDEWPLETSADALVDRTEIRCQSKGASSTPSSSGNQDAIMELLSSLQDQLNSLASRAQTNSPSHITPTLLVDDDSGPDSFLSAIDNDTSAAQACLGRVEETLYAPSRSFFGLPSPGCSLNTSRAESSRGSVSGPARHGQHHEDDASDHADFTVVVNRNPPAQAPTPKDGEMSPLLRFLTLMRFQEAMRLLCVYQEVIGDLHPIIDIDRVTAQARSSYSDLHSAPWTASTSGTEVVSTDDLIILNLALIIALRAESATEGCNNENTIRDSIQDAINARLAAPVSSIKHVAIIVLKGSYDFFSDVPRSAWRMCGIAGRMLMELGFHNGEMSEHMLDSPARRTEVWTLMSSIVILDRQWSAAAGLPTNFHESSFGPIFTSSIKMPYLKAMLSFILLRDKFNDPIARAAKAQRYDDEDAFEVMNFQIEQWRKKTVGDHQMTQPWHLSPLSQPPTWTILLNLRAESVRSLLFQPHFFSRSDVQTSKKYLRPAIEVLFDVCNVMYNLNTTTDIYRKQQPFYQPLLASASALGFVLTASLENNRAALLPSVPEETAVAMGRSYEMAVALATGYAGTSKAALGLSKKLSTVRGSLKSLGMLKSCNGTSGGSTNNSEDGDSEVSLADGARSVRASSRSRLGPRMAQPVGHTVHQARNDGVVTTESGDMLENHSGGFPDSGWADREPLEIDWMGGDVGDTFLKGMFQVDSTQI